MVTPADIRLLDALTSDTPFCTTNHQLAARLGCSPATVKNRVTRLLGLAGVRNRAALAAWWLWRNDDNHIQV